MVSMAHTGSDLINALQDMDAKAVGGGGQEITQVYRHTFTMPEYADYVQEHANRHVSSQTLHYARYGWHEQLAPAMDVCDRAVKMVETEVDVFEPVNAVTGMSVDIGAAIAGMPDDMIDFPLVSATRIGNVITLCADVQCLAMISDQAVRQRGYVIAGLAMALNRLGYQTTLWVSDEYWCYNRPQEKIIIRTLVKSPNDMIDPSRIMFAYAHEGVQRELGFALASVEKGVDGKYGQALNSASMGGVTATTRDIGDNCLYIPPLHRTSNTMNAEAEIRQFLIQIGAIPGDPDE